MAERLYDRIFTSLALRKVYHFAGGLALFLIACFFGDAGIFAALVFYFLAFLVLGRRISFAVLGVLLLFAITRSRFATLGAIIIFTIGDGLAALIGSSFGRTPLPWNGSKTTLGSVAFLASSIVSMAVFTGNAALASGWGTLWFILLPSTAACLVEGLPITVIRDRKPDDNLLVILTSGLILHLLVLLLGTPDMSCCRIPA